MFKGLDKGIVIEWFKNNYLNYEDILKNLIMFGDVVNDIFVFEKVVYFCVLKLSLLEVENVVNYVVCFLIENGIIEFFEKYIN